MIETPPSFAATPEGCDVLTEMLQAVRLTGSVFHPRQLRQPVGDRRGRRL
jgi:hypothetical protein